jgi:hypothetical protein
LSATYAQDDNALVRDANQPLGRVSHKRTADEPWRLPMRIAQPTQSSQAPLVACKEATSSRPEPPRPLSLPDIESYANAVGGERMRQPEGRARGPRSKSPRTHRNQRRATTGQTGQSAQANARVPPPSVYETALLRVAGRHREGSNEWVAGGSEGQAC